MSNLRRLVWSKGMFLTPQHFQAQDNCIEDSLQFRFAASQFANWGVTELVIDEEALANGQFTLTRLRGILPDGTLIDCPDADSLPASRSVAPFFSATQDLLDVHVALPERVSQGRNFLGALPEEAASTSEGKVRYTARVQEIRDENGLDEDKPIQFAHKNLQFLFGGENLDGYVSLRVAQMSRTPTGAYTLNPEHVPACLNVGASGYLMALLRRQIEILGTKRQSLSGARRQQGKALADFGPAEASSFWLLHTVNTYLPEFQHIWAVKRGHPEPLFAAMLRLAGALSTFSFDADPRALPVYAHDNLGQCFSALDAHIRGLLETVLPSKCISVPLRQTAEKYIWSGSISEEQWLRNSQFFLAVSAQMGLDDLIRKVLNLVKVSPPDEIQRLVRHSLPGLTLRHTPTPPSAISSRTDSQYFGLNQTGRLWEGIVRSHNLSVFIPSDILEAKPDLLIVLE